MDAFSAHPIRFDLQHVSYYHVAIPLAPALAFRLPSAAPLALSERAVYVQGRRVAVVDPPPNLPS